MKRRILLHIGSPKCGSTYLQRVLLQNTGNLADVDAIYPDPAGKHPGNGTGLQGLSARQLEALLEMPTRKGKTLVLSHEDLFAQAACHRGFISLCQDLGIEVQVVVFLRPFSEFIFGDYSQFMKQYFECFLAKRDAYQGQSFEEFAVKRCKVLAVIGYLRAWARECSDHRLIVSGHLNIRTVFEKLLGEPGLNWQVHPGETNPSLRVQDCDAIAKAIRDKTRPNIEIRELFKAAFKQTATADIGKTEERIAWIEALFAKQNRYLLDEFGIDNFLPNSH